MTAGFPQLTAAAVAVTATATALLGCGTARSPRTTSIERLVEQARPIGAGHRFRPGISGHPAAPCHRRLGHRFPAHLEVFARNRVVIVPAGIGVAGARTRDGLLVAARCYGPSVTLDPTGVLYTVPGAAVDLHDVFAAWGTSLTRTALAGFRAPPGESVRIFRDGRRVLGAPGALVVTPRSEIVLEVGPYVPPHTSYTFPRAVSAPARIVRLASWPPRSSTARAVSAGR